MATHSSVLAWRILGTGEPGGLLSMGSHRVGHDWSNLAAAAAAAWMMNQIALTLVDFQQKRRAKDRCWYSEDKSVGLDLWCRALGPQWKWKSCLTLCDHMDYTVQGILQARILEWVAFHFARGSSQPRDWTRVSGIAGRFFTSWATSEAHPLLCYCCC